MPTDFESSAKLGLVLVGGDEIFYSLAFSSRRNQPMFHSLVNILDSAPMVRSSGLDLHRNHVSENSILSVAVLGELWALI